MGDTDGPAAVIEVAVVIQGIRRINKLCRYLVIPQGRFELLYSDERETSTKARIYQCRTILKPRGAHALKFTLHRCRG